MVEITFIRSSLSFRKKTPINSAKTMLVSRNAVTSAIGAWVKAQVTIAYAAKDAPPPTRKTFFPPRQHAAEGAGRTQCQEHRHDYAVTDGEPGIKPERGAGQPRTQPVHQGIGGNKTSCGKCQSSRFPVPLPVRTPDQSQADDARTDQKDGGQLHGSHLHPEPGDRHRRHDQRRRSAGDRIDLRQITGTVGAEQKELIANMKRNPAKEVGQCFGRRQWNKRQGSEGKGQMPQHDSCHRHQLVRAAFDEGIPAGMQNGGTNHGNENGCRHCLSDPLGPQVR